MSNQREIVLRTDICGLRKFITGKVRDVYDLGETLLIVATDRISAFDVVLPTGIPDKGRVLTGLSQFWFEQTRDIVPNHMITTDVAEIGDALTKSGSELTPNLRDVLDGRSMLVKKCQAVPLECVVRGYLAGSAWKEYSALFSHGGEVRLHDLPLPVGLRESDKLPTPLFTPATKAVTGHDENISQDQAAEIAGAELTRLLAATSLSLYTHAHDYADARGLILADTKFEFGLIGSDLYLIDEALTPDSSRYWEGAAYKPGRSQASFDKQFVRDYLETLDWDKTDPGPELPEEIVERTADKYREAYRRITGEALPS